VENVGCNLCKSENLEYLYQIPDEKFNPSEVFSVVECKDCGLGFVNPRPSPLEMSRYYPPEFYQTLSGSEPKDLERLKSQAEYISKYISKSNDKRLLDVGCANGAFLKLMKSNGYNVHGVDPYSPIQDSMDMRIYKTDLPRLPICEPYFDAITAWAVLEHVHDPKAYFEKVGQILNKDGIFVFFVPNFRSLAVKRLYSEDVPRHLYFFTPENIFRYADEAGLKVELIDYKNKYFIYNPNRWLLYFVHKVLGTKFMWPVNISYSQFIEAGGMKRNLSSLIKFFLFHPISFLDSLLAPMVGEIERYTKKYAAVIYVVRKR